METPTCWLFSITTPRPTRHKRIQLTMTPDNELIRANVATKRADDDYLWHQHGRSDVVDRDTVLWRNCYRIAYDHMHVSNHDLKDRD
ncbi:hypothetical protein PBI_HILLTOPFARM_94 [Mycobacterium phage Hilltopfarm]|nr:hypothetical protein PBI_HILLTOPFARM_94 [Mycobacterium phage Hilltopfarm]